MKLSEKVLLYRELAKLVNADFHLDRSVRLLLKQNPSHARRMWLQGLERGLAEGKGITESIKAHCGPFTGTLEIALIDAGERSGRLGDGFIHLARYFEAWYVATRQALGAVIYPLVLAHLAIFLPELPAFVTASMQGDSISWRSVLMPLAVLWLILLSFSPMALAHTPGGGISGGGQVAGPHPLHRQRAQALGAGAFRPGLPCLHAGLHADDGVHAAGRRGLPQRAAAACV